MSEEKDTDLNDHAFDCYGLQLIFLISVYVNRFQQNHESHSAWVRSCGQIFYNECDSMQELFDGALRRAELGPTLVRQLPDMCRAVFAWSGVAAPEYCLTETHVDKAQIFWNLWIVGLHIEALRYVYEHPGIWK